MWIEWHYVARAHHSYRRAVCKDSTNLDKTHSLLRSMGKKDAAGVQGAPVDQYRKQIGKQDYKKSKKEIRSSKARADALKTATPVKDTLLILTTGVLLVFGLYFGLYWYLDKS